MGLNSGAVVVGRIGDDLVIFPKNASKCRCDSSRCPDGREQGSLGHSSDGQAPIGERPARRKTQGGKVVRNDSRPRLPTRTSDENPRRWPTWHPSERPCQAAARRWLRPACWRSPPACSILLNPIALRIRKGVSFSHSLLRPRTSPTSSPLSGAQGAHRSSEP